MARTELSGDEQIKDATVALKDLVANFLAGQDWNITAGSNNNTIIGLSDASDPTSPATKSQLDAAVAAINASLNGFLEFKGVLDAAAGAAAFEALAHSKGDFYKIGTSGTIAGEAVNAGDNLYFEADVLAGAITSADFTVIDSTEAPDIIRDADVQDNLTTADASQVLSANQGVVIKALIDALDAQVNNRVVGEQLTATQSIAVLPATSALPISGTLAVYRNGARMLEGSGNDFTVAYGTGVITFEYTLKSADNIQVDYEHL